jgi:hypothetical protein
VQVHIASAQPQLILPADIVSSACEQMSLSIIGTSLHESVSMFRPDFNGKNKKKNH